MRILTAGFVLAVFLFLGLSGPLWANEAHSKIPEQAAKMGPAFEPGG